MLTKKLLIVIPLTVTVIGGLIVAKHGTIYDYLKRLIKRPSDNTLTNIKAPYEIPIGSWTKISATFHGTLERGFLTCQIIDCLGKYNWCEAKNTVKDLGPNRQTGSLNFKNEKRSFTWPIRPEPTLTKGKGKLIIGVYEEKDFVENGHITENRRHIALEPREILLV